MEKSLTTGLFRGLAIVSEKANGLPKTRVAAAGSKNSYRYTPLDQIVSYLRPILKEAGLVVSQTTETDGGRVGVSTIVFSADGGYIESTCFAADVGETETIVTGPHFDGRGIYKKLVEGTTETSTTRAPGGPSGMSPIQRLGSEITYLRRYSLCAALCLAADDDADGWVVSESEPEKERAAAAKRERREKMLTDRARELCKTIPDLGPLTDAQLVELWASLCAPVVSPIAPAPEPAPIAAPIETAPEKSAPPKVEEKVKPETKTEPKEKRK